MTAILDIADPDQVDTPETREWFYDRLRDVSGAGAPFEDEDNRFGEAYLCCLRCDREWQVYQLAAQFHSAWRRLREREVELIALADKRVARARADSEQIIANLLARSDP